jgi:hypothetical protein
MAVDVRRRSTKGPVKRKVTEGRRRVEKKDGRVYDYSSLRASTGIVVPEVKKIMLDRERMNAQRSSHRTHIIYPSEMARSGWCVRATYYRMTGCPLPESKSSFTMENVFAQGNAIHDKWQGWLSETGKLWGDWRCTRCAEYVKDSVKPGDFFSGSCVGTGWVKMNGTSGHFTRDLVNVVAEAFPHDWKYKEVTLKSVSLPVSGHADGALTGHDCLIELKSLGVGSLRYEAPSMLDRHTHLVDGRKVTDIDGLWKDFHRPLTSHLKQGNIYLWMAQEMGLPFKKISFVYEFKANQQVKEFVVDYSEDIIAEQLAAAKMIQACIDRKIVPACPFNGCSQCRAYEKETKEN